MTKLFVTRKLCIDCRWAVHRHPNLTNFLGLSLHALNSDGRPLPDYMTGQPAKTYHKSCDQTRLDTQLCGPEGRYWEAKP